MSAVRCDGHVQIDNRTDGESDDRFRRLVGDESWQTLPIAVRRRFSKRVATGQTVTYAGIVTRVEFSLCGRLLANALRLIGAPLPLSSDTGVATVVAVTEEGASGGQNWTRIYGRKLGFPQVVHSTKRFRGSTGLEEHIGAGVSIALGVRVESGALVFEGQGYRLTAGRWSIGVPMMLIPLELTVAHREIDAASFRFTLTLAHPWFGVMIHQEARYREDVA